MFNEMFNEDCIGCSLERSGFIVRLREFCREVNNNCPCKLCLVKIMCRDDTVCKEYNKINKKYYRDKALERK